MSSAERHHISNQMEVVEVLFEQDDVRGDPWVEKVEVYSLLKIGIWGRMVRLDGMVLIPWSAVSYIMKVDTDE